MYFIGSQAKNIESTVKALLKSHFTDALGNEEYSELFAPWYGVDVLVTGDGMEAGAKPFAHFTKTGCVSRVWRKKLDGNIEVGTEHQWSFTVRASADAKSGAISSVSEPITSGVLLGDALMNLVNGNGRAALDAIGLERAKLEPGNDAEDEDGTQTGLYTLTFSTFSLPSIPEPTP